MWIKRITTIFMEGGITLSEAKLDLILSEIQGVKQDQQSLHEEFRGVKQDQQSLHEEFRGVKQDQQLMHEELRVVKQDQQLMHAELQGLKQGKQQMHHRFDVLESKVDRNQADIVSIKESIARIERSVHEDVVTILETIEGNNQAKNAEISTLNQRLFRVESTVQKITEHEGI